MDGNNCAYFWRRAPPGARPRHVGSARTAPTKEHQHTNEGERRRNQGRPIKAQGARAPRNDKKGEGSTPERSRKARGETITRTEMRRKDVFSLEFFFAWK